MSNEPPQGAQSADPVREAAGFVVALFTVHHDQSPGFGGLVVSIAYPYLVLGERETRPLFHHVAPSMEPLPGAAFLVGPERRVMDRSEGFSPEHAALIAAAPDLLAALIELIAAGRAYTEPGDADDISLMLRFGQADEAARAAINKALGGTEPKKDQP